MVGIEINPVYSIRPDSSRILFAKQNKYVPSLTQLSVQIRLTTNRESCYDFHESSLSANIFLVKLPIKVTVKSRGSLTCLVINTMLVHSERFFPKVHFRNRTEMSRVGGPDRSFWNRRFLPSSTEFACSILCTYYCPKVCEGFCVPKIDSESTKWNIKRFCTGNTAKN